MYRHGFNYMCGFSPDWKRFVRIPRHPYDVKCSKQEGVKAGRPTPYIGAPSEVNYFFPAPETERFIYKVWVDMAFMPTKKRPTT